MDPKALYRLLEEEPSLRFGSFGLLIAVFLSAVRGLASDNPSDSGIAMQYFEDDDGLFSIFCHELGIEPIEFRKRL